MVKIDHIIFKSNAYSSVISEKKDQSFGKAKDCKFGQWYYHEGQQRFGGSQAFKMLEQPHKQIHDYIAQNIEFVEAQNVTQHKQQIVDNFEKMEKESDKLFELLDKMLEEKSNHS
ncbi:MAG: CZB domain-containing protein [Campylobacterota bacterium]